MAEIDWDAVGEALAKREGCWSDFCIATVCDGAEHVDATGYTWRQERGQTYNPRTCEYE